MDTGSLKFPKASHVRPKLSTEEKDAITKRLLVCLYLVYQGHTEDLDFMMQTTEMDHIKNKTQGDRYKIDNLQLLSHEIHSVKTDSGKYFDFRPVGLKEWLKKTGFNKLIIF